jgi:glycolate oxidase FAD binding subunit
VTVKVLPRPPIAVTLVVEGLQPSDAVEFMSQAMGSHADVAAAAHVPAITAIRLEGFEPSVAARCRILENIALVRPMAEKDARAFWAGLAVPLPHENILWRINIPSSRAAELVADQNGSWQMDWAGGLIWLASDNAITVRQTAEALGGHAFLVRAPEAFRRAVPTLHPQPKGVAALEQRVRDAFDPMGVFETGRF